MHSFFVQLAIFKVSSYLELSRSNFMILKKKEYAMLTVFIASIIISSIIFKNYWLSTLNGILGLLSIFLQAKGLIIGQFVGIADSLCYDRIYTKQAIHIKMEVTL